MIKSLYLKIYYAIVFVLFIDSMVPWFTFNVNKLILESVALVLIAVVAIRFRLFSKTYNKTLLVLFLFFCLWMARYNTFFGIINCIVHWLILATIIRLRDEYKADLIRFITKWFGILMLISLTGYVFYLIGVPMRYTYTEFGDSYSFDNYYFFLQRELFRFQGPFIEPGHLTMGLAPLLFLNKYNLKNVYVVFLFIAQILSFSLAGYISLVVGFCIISYLSNFRTVVGSVLILFFFVLGAVVFAKSYLDDEVFKILILDRLQFDEGGGLVGDDRSSYYLDQQFSKVVSSSSIITGVYFDQELSEKGVAGFKRFFVENGLIGLILLLLSYFSVLTPIRKDKKTRKEVFLFILFLLMLLYQNAYPSWYFVTIPLICSAAFFLKQMIIE